MNITQALSFIHKTVWLGSKPGLSRTEHLLSLMGNPHKKLKFVHVAGTNGKGSTSACIASILQEAGYKTGLYTSPYINTFNERMRVDGEMITDDELCRLCEYIKPLSDSMTDDPPTEFELITALAMQYFYEKKCDIVVLEVGMGGELDSTNVIDSPETAVICAIDLDHTSFLGDTVEKVAEAKAGIIKKGTSVALYDCEKNVYDVFDTRCKNVGASLTVAGFDKISDVRYSLESTKFNFGKYKNITLSLVGSYQPKNASVAITAVELLRQKGYKISDKNIYDGLENVRWQGRFEILGKNPTFVLDGAHNPHGMRGTVEGLYQHFGDKKIHFVVGAMADKDVEGMMSMLIPLADSFIAVKPDNPRAMEAETLSGLLTDLGAKAQSAESIVKAVELSVQRAGKDGVVACLGSLYFSGEIRRAYLSLSGDVNE
ncbi:MAG: bifunctional folylpolyglutamate synthase/dihydrofolate synthase [Clostridia bacterium]|nr:bifunctional folylpolyglutamate synthase/dihydrofolate synthase [Clostridia bacterium]